jgi:cytochrome c oxidase subunit II
MKDYEALIAKWGTPEDPVQWGELLWRNRCSTCHTVDGKLSTGPSWFELWGKTESFTNAPDQVVDENYIRESILFPGAKIVKSFKNQMTPPVLSEEQINAIIMFMKSPKVAGKNAPAGEAGAGEPKPTEGEAKK